MESNVIFCPRLALALAARRSAIMRIAAMAAMLAWCDLVLPVEAETLADLGVDFSMWQQMRPGNFKCHHSCERDGCFDVADQTECQNRAVEAGNDYYSFRPSDGKCTTSASCEKSDATYADWHIYHKDALWEQWKDFNCKCHQHCGSSEKELCVVVETQKECQNRAAQAGHKYYSYRPSHKKCTTTDICRPFGGKHDKPDSVYTDWHVYRYKVAEVALPSSEEL
jgi:hypothetical protein